MSGEGIFISYRRDDTADVAVAIYDEMARHVGQQLIYKDLGSHSQSANFGGYVEHIKAVLPNCRVALVLIGSHWLDTRGAAGSRRIDDEQDWVRLEVETALLTPELHVVPILVDGARMPRSEEVPESLKALLARDAAIIRRGPDFLSDVQRLAIMLRLRVNTSMPDPDKFDDKTRRLGRSLDLRILQAVIALGGENVERVRIREFAGATSANLSRILTRLGGAGFLTMSRVGKSVRWTITPSGREFADRSRESGQQISVVRSVLNYHVPVVLRDQDRTRSSFHPSATPAARSKMKGEPQVVDVMFATDRNVTPHTTPVVMSETYSGRLRYGIVQVTIPPNHFIGRMETPARVAGVRLSYNPMRHVTLNFVQILSVDAFYSRLTLRGSEKNGVFVFIHGFNTNFEDAARRTAQLHYDLKFTGVPVCYSWSSTGKLGPGEYNRDREQSTVTAAHLREFLDDLSIRANASCLNVVAHSMGNKALVEALKDWRPARESPLKHLILVAPDVGKEHFSQLAEAFRATAQRTTLYGSRQDLALRLSRMWAGNVERVGDANPPVIMPPVETVDVTEMKIPYDALSHFLLDDAFVIEDMKSLWDSDKPAGQRLRLREMVASDGGVYWHMVRR